MKDKRFHVIIGETIITRFDDEIEAKKFAKMISKRDESVVTVVDNFTGEESRYEEFDFFWF